ncbi:MAG TPA: CHRD domain-containing protein [Vicinamibacteria bacterium]|nr:CHRD domain-containing protein [Vicinamibacteria bacterium]
MRCPTVVRALAFIPIALSLGACNDASKGQTLFHAALSAANEVPARDTGANGAAGFTVDGDRVLYSIEANQIGNITMSHIHSGAEGVNGPVRVFLFRGPTTGTVNGRLVEGSFTAADVTGISFEELLAEMQAGTAYVNVHTTQFPAGEMRGQTQLVR